MKKCTKIKILSAAFALLLGTATTQASITADNFVLIDHQGKAQELYYRRDAKAIILVSHGNGCQIVRSTLSDLDAIYNDYKDQGVEVLMLNANLQDNRKSIAATAKEWGINYPILDDRTQVIAKSLELNRTGEVLVINPQTWEVVYRGPISDRVDFERQKETASKRYVRNALDALLAGKEVAVNKINAPGCIMNYEKIDGAQISYAETIAPILQENCTACHVQGGIAPWAMSEYNMVRGFAPMIREVLRTKRMPPWHADPEIGHWANEVGISDKDKQTLIAWIEAGAPRGDGDDPLPKVSALENKWTLGEPDLVIDIPEFKIPASGTVDYQFPTVPNPLDKGVWIVAAEVIPGDPKAVHHILAGSSDKDPSGSITEIFENFILTYAPGNEASHMPEGTGVFVPKGGMYQFQMHYTPYGKETVDRSRLGLYFSDTPPANFYREVVIANQLLAIPAHAEAHEEKAYFVFDKEADLHALFPHSHYRGASSTFEVEYPDGSKELLLSVPNYDFNWQRTYQFSETKRLPAGSRLVHRTIYNNSAKNRGNPAPEEPVYWGLQSEQEMLYGSVGYSWVEESSSKKIHNDGLTGIQQLMGFMDQDLDDKVSYEELGPRLKRAGRENFAKFDVDQDEGLNTQEMAAMIQHFQRKRKR